MEAGKGHCESNADITVDRGLFLTGEGGVYDRCTIKAIIWCFESFLINMESISYVGSRVATGSNPTLTARLESIT
jgi:hypothetical protein